MKLNPTKVSVLDFLGLLFCVIGILAGYIVLASF
jgi:hypothetical protein